MYRLDRQHLDGTALIDFNALIEAMAPQKVLRCSTIKAGSSEGVADIRAKSGGGMDWYAMVTTALLLKILNFQQDV
jgi:hypothetical protein